MNETGDVGVVVSSCDKYEDLWEPFFTLYYRYWPDCPWPTYLITDEAEFRHERVITLRAGPDQGWGIRCRNALRQIPHKYVLMLLEDFFFYDYANTAELTRLVGVMEETDAAYLRIWPSPGPDTPLENVAGVGVISPGAEYRCSLQAAFWRRESLLDLIAETDTPWSFERGSQHSDAHPKPFLSVARERDMSKARFALSYVFGVIGGKWTRAGLELLAREGISVDISARGVRTWRVVAKERLAHAIRYGWLGRQLPVKALVKVVRLVTHSQWPL